MGGNATTTELNLNIVADMAAPQIIGFTTNESSVSQLENFRVISDKSVTLDNTDAIRLVEAGTNRLFNTADDRLIPIVNVRTLTNFNTIDIQTPLVGIGKYQLEIDRARLRSSSGIALGTGIETREISATGLYGLPSGYSLSFANAYLNNDGYMDLLVGNTASGGITALMTNQYGAVARKQNSLNALTVKDAVLEDINKDGKMDAILVLAGSGYGSNNSIGISLGNGDGTFAETPTVIEIPNQNPNALAFGDFNSDGYVDVVAYRRGSGEISLLSGSSTGFVFQSTFFTGKPINSLTVGDVGGDSKLDLVVASDTNDVELWINQGNSTFAASNGFVTGNNPDKVVVADFDRDGFTDLALVNNFNVNGSFATGVSLWYGSNNGSFGSRTNYITYYGVTDLAVGDLDGDGYLDLVTANSYSSTFSVLTNKKNRSFTTTDYYSQSYAKKLKLIDWNYDGKLDVVLMNEFGISNTLTPYLGNGDGTIAAIIAPPFDPGVGGGEV
jgi:hypothetical protein